jgi:hypothetical protein
LTEENETLRRELGEAETTINRMKKENVGARLELERCYRSAVGGGY